MVPWAICAAALACLKENSEIVYQRVSMSIEDAFQASFASSFAGVLPSFRPIDSITTALGLSTMP